MYLLARGAGQLLNRWLARLNLTWRIKAWLKWPVQILAVAVALVFVRSSRIETIAQYIRASKIDVVSTNEHRSYIYGALVSRLAGRVPLIFSRGSLRGHEGSASLQRLLERYILHPEAKVAICNSEAIAQELLAEGIPRSKIRVIYNGIDLPSFSQALVHRGTAAATFWH